MSHFTQAPLVPKPQEAFAPGLPCLLKNYASASILYDVSLWCASDKLFTGRYLLKDGEKWERMIP